MNTKKKCTINNLFQFNARLKRLIRRKRSKKISQLITNNDTPISTWTNVARLKIIFFILWNLFSFHWKYNKCLRFDYNGRSKHLVPNDKLLFRLFELKLCKFIAWRFVTIPNRYLNLVSLYAVCYITKGGWKWPKHTHSANAIV